jgi:hypothetical protein
VAGRFPLYTDTDIRGPIVDGLRRRGWDVLRGIDAHAEGAADPIHFLAASEAGRVLVSNDEDQIVIAESWIAEGRPFAGLISWPQDWSKRYTVGAFLDAFDEIAAEDKPFRYPIVFLRPRT